MLASDTVSASTCTILPQGSEEDVHSSVCSALVLTFFTSVCWVVCQQDLNEPNLVDFCLWVVWGFGVLFCFVFSCGLIFLFVCLFGCFKFCFKIESRYFSSKPFQLTGLHSNFRTNWQILTFRRWANRRSWPPKEAADTEGRRKGTKCDMMAILSIASCVSVFVCCFAFEHGLDKKVFKIRRAPWPTYLNILHDNKWI